MCLRKDEFLCLVYTFICIGGERLMQKHKGARHLNSHFYCLKRHRLKSTLSSNDFSFQANRYGRKQLSNLCRFEEQHQQWLCGTCDVLALA